MVSIDFVANELSKLYPEHKFMPQDRSSYKVIIIDGKSELRIQNISLESNHPTSSVWLKSIMDAVGQMFKTEKVKGTIEAYSKEMAKDIENEE